MSKDFSPNCLTVFHLASIKSVPGVFPLGAKLTTHLHLVPKIGISGDIILLLHMPSMAHPRTSRFYHIISDLQGKIFYHFRPSTSITETKGNTPLK